MKIVVYNWASSAKNLPDWFKHNKVIEVEDLFDAAKKLYATGNNVMIYHSAGIPTIFVDDGRFSQR